MTTNESNETAVRTDFTGLAVGVKVVLKPNGNRYMVDRVHTNGYLDLRNIWTGRCLTEHPETLAKRFPNATRS